MATRGIFGILRLHRLNVPRSPATIYEGRDPQENIERTSFLEAPVPILSFLTCAQFCSSSGSKVIAFRNQIDLHVDHGTTLNTG